MRAVGRRRLLFGAASLVAGVSLGACRRHERNRTLHFEKGTYPGPKDETLTVEQLDALRRRAANQMM